MSDEAVELLEEDEVAGEPGQVESSLNLVVEGEDVEILDAPVSENPEEEVE